jgi:hypothetical protein
VIRKGDVVWIPAGVKHWHGATPTTTMTHIAFQEQLDGRAVDWLEKVTDDCCRSELVNGESIVLFTFRLYWKHALNTEFLCGDELGCTDRRD